MKLNILVTWLFLLALTSHSVLAIEEIEPEKLEAIRELMRVTNAQANRAEFSAAFTRQMLTILRAKNPDLSEKAIQIVTDEVTVTINEELDDESLQLLIYPIYAKYLTLEELQGLIVFNNSSVGRKANQVMPQLMQESLEAAQQWSQMVGPKISKRVAVRFREEGITTPAATN